MIKLTTDEIVTMCEKLASKYRQHHMRDDLIAEGVLAVYERLDNTPDDYPASLYRRANKAMYDYLNVKTKAVTIPTSRAATEVALGNEYTGQNYSDEGKKALRQALSSTTVQFDEEFMLAVEDCTKDYEQKDYLKKGFHKLTEREIVIIKMRYFDDMTQEEVAIRQGVSRQAIALCEDKALSKMSKL